MIQEPSTQLSKNPCDWFLLYDENLPIRGTTMQLFANTQEFIFGFGLLVAIKEQTTEYFKFVISDSDHFTQLLDTLESDSPEKREFTVENVTFALDSSTFEINLPELDDKNPARTVVYTVEDAQDLIKWGRAILAGEKFVRE